MKRFSGIFGLLLAFTIAANGESWSLERALDYALSHNPDARLARQRIVASKAALADADAAFLPRLQLQSSYNGTDNPMQVFGSILNQRSYKSSLNFNDVPDVDNFNAKLLATVPIYAGGRNAANRDAARAATKAAQQDNEAVRNELAFEVVRSFETVLKTRQFIGATEAAVNAFEQSLAIARKRVDAGNLLKSEMLDVEVRLAQAREDVVRARNANKIAERALRNLLGIEHGEFAVADEPSTLIVPVTGDFSRRPELVASREHQRAAEAEVRAAKSGYRPRVSAFGSLDYDAGLATRGDGASYTAGIMAQWDLWDGFSTRAKVRHAEANAVSVREEERKLRLALDLELEQARLNLESSNERLAATGKAVEQAAESATLTRNRFEQGLALSTQLIDAETALVGARVRRAEAESDRRIAIAALRKATALPQLEAISSSK